MHETPSQFLNGPFTRTAARAAGLTDRMLAGRRYEAIHPGVYVHRDCPRSFDVLLEAARLAVPAHARTTGQTRLRELGLDFGPESPLRFVVEGDLHLVPRGVFLHRTVKMPVVGPDGEVTAAAAYIAFCRQARYIDAVKVGDWLLHARHMSVAEVVELASAEPWRDGSSEALLVVDELDGRARSLPESELRVLIIASGLPRPDVNAVVDSSAEEPTIVDLWYTAFGLAVEYEGAQHQEDRDQYTTDIARYACLRRMSAEYIQVTKEGLRQPRRVVGEVFRALLGRGYTGPVPAFGDRWRRVFSPLHDLVEVRRREDAA